MRDVAVVSFKQTLYPPGAQANDVEMLMPVIAEAIGRSGIPRADIGFTVSGSCDYISGQPFSFVQALDAVGAWPPIRESHVEMDGAWALYEAWVRLQCGDVDSALVYAFGKPSAATELRDVMTLQLDPYFEAPLWPDAVAVAALQARALIDAGRCTEGDLADIALRSRYAKSDPDARMVAPRATADDILADPYVVAPLRTHACPPVTDGAAAIVLAAGDLARSSNNRPAWIRGIDHRIEPHGLGARDLTDSPSTRIAAEKAGVHSHPSIDLAELHAPFAHQEIILRDALGLNDSVNINPSGGALSANPMMVAGLARIGEAAQRIIDGTATRAVAHATSGPCLQQNLVCVLEGE